MPRPVAVAGRASVFKDARFFQRIEFQRISIEIFCGSETLYPVTTPKTFDCPSARADFPILQTEVRGKPLTYLDNAATAQKPQRVLDALKDYYAAENANIHRGVHYLSEMATDAYEGTRAKLAGMLNLPDPDEIIFTRGATESINLVAHGFTETVLQPGDEILITHMVDLIFVQEIKLIMKKYLEK